PAPTDLVLAPGFPPRAHLPSRRSRAPGSGQLRPSDLQALWRRLLPGLDCPFGSEPGRLRCPRPVPHRERAAVGLPDAEATPGRSDGAAPLPSRTRALRLAAQ